MTSALAICGCALILKLRCLFGRQTNRIKAIRMLDEPLKQNNGAADFQRRLVRRLLNVIRVYNICPWF